MCVCRCRQERDKFAGEAVAAKDLCERALADITALAADRDAARSDITDLLTERDAALADAAVLRVERDGLADNLAAARVELEVGQPNVEERGV